MTTYREYVIRCKTCNEQIACFASTYEDLLANGLTIEEALNNLGIMLPCSRAAMMNPTYVDFNMENRDAVEGIIPVEAVTNDFMQRQDLAKENTSNPVFASCLISNMKNIPHIQQLGTPVIRIGNQTTERSLTDVPTHVVEQPQSQIIAPIIPLDLSEFAQPIGVGIPVQMLEVETEFKEPTIPGVPTINPNPKLPQVKVHVGAGKYCVVLNGRTYLAR